MNMSQIMDIRYLWSPLGVCLVLAGCGNDTNASPVDAGLADAAVADAQPADAALPAEPSGVDVYFPPPRSRTELDAITVRGTAMDDDGIAAIHVAGVAATSDDGFATWQATVPLQPGVNLLTVDKQDGAGNLTVGVAQVEVVNALLLNDLRRMVLDGTRNRVLVADANQDALVAVDLDSALPTRVPDSALPRPIYNPPVATMAMDPDQRRLWLASSEIEVRTILLWLDLITGERRVVADATTGSGIGLFDITAIAVDAAGNRVLLFDAEHQAVVAVDQATGERTVLASVGVGSGPALAGVSCMAVDAARSRLLAAATWEQQDVLHQALIAVDLSTGDRTVIADDSTGAGPAPGPARGLDLEPGGNRAWLSVADGFLSKVIAVDLSTGDRTLIAELGVSDQRLPGIGALVRDPARDRVLVLDDPRRIMAVGQGGAAAPWLNQVIIGLGPFLSTSQALGLDDVRGRAFFLGRPREGEVMSLGIWPQEIAGWRSFVTESNGSRRGPLRGARDMILDLPRDRAIVSSNDKEFGTSVLYSLDLDSGEHAKLAGPGTALGPLPDLLGSIAMDTLHHSILGVTPDTLLSVDLSTGGYIVISDAATGTGPALANPRGLAVDARQQRAIVVNDEVSLLSIELETGDRSTLSELGIGPGGERHELGDTALDLAHQRVLVTEPRTDTRPTRVWSVSLTGGASTELVGPTAGAGPPIQDSLGSIAVDSRRDLAVTQAATKVFMVDLVTLQRVIVSD